MRDRDDARARWNARHAARPAHEEPAGFLLAHADRLPRPGRALDVAGGTGRNAVWLARHGLTTTLVDVSDEACRRARDLAERAGVDVQVLRRDVTVEGLPPGSWDVILFHHFLDRDLLAAASQALVPGGLLLVAQPTVHNLERHDRPTRRWLLDEGELAAMASTWSGIEVLEAVESWTDEGRHEARLIARRAVAA